MKNRRVKRKEKKTEEKGEQVDEQKGEGEAVKDGLVLGDLCCIIEGPLAKDHVIARC